MFLKKKKNLSRNYPRCRYTHDKPDCRLFETSQESWEWLISSKQCHEHNKCRSRTKKITTLWTLLKVLYTSSKSVRNILTSLSPNTTCNSGSDILTVGKSVSTGNTGRLPWVILIAPFTPFYLLLCVQLFLHVKSSEPIAGHVSFTVVFNLFWIATRYSNPL